MYCCLLRKQEAEKEKREVGIPHYSVFSWSKSRLIIKRCQMCQCLNLQSLDSCWLHRLVPSLISSSSQLISLSEPEDWAAAIHLDQLSWLQPPGEAEFFLHWRRRRAHSERQDLCKINWMWAWVSHTQKLVDESDAKDFRCAGHEPIEKSMLQVPLLHIED